MSTAQYSLDQIYQLPSAARERKKRKPLPFRTAGRLVSLRRIAGLLLAAIVCLLTGKVSLQTFASDPVDERLTQDDERDEARTAVPKREREARDERRREAPKAADAALVDTEPWKQFRVSHGISSGSAIPFPPRRPGIQAEPPKIISQEDLAELELLGKRYREARRLFEKRRQRIRGAMASGATVEAGTRSAAMKTREVLVVL
jgi:hypothetical protein